LAVEKCMGLKKGEKHKVLGRIEIVSVRKESLWDITDEEVVKEGFPDMRRRDFVDMFRSAMKCEFTAVVTRIEFRKLEDDEA